MPQDIKNTHTKKITKEKMWELLKKGVYVDISKIDKHSGTIDKK